jgi:hypothetical protein
MSKQMFDVLVRTSVTNLPNVVALAGDETQILSINVVKEMPALPAKFNAGSTSRFVGGMKNKGISGEELTLQTLKKAGGAPITLQQLQQAFVQRGFAAHSCHACLSKLVRDKKVRRFSDGSIGLMGGTVIHQGAGAVLADT